MNFEKRTESLWDVRMSDALRDLQGLLNKGETIKFIVTGQGDIILGTGLHDSIAAENGIYLINVYIEGQFKLVEGKLKWGYSDNRERQTAIEEKIEKFLRTKGIEFKS